MNSPEVDACVVRASYEIGAPVVRRDIEHHVRVGARERTNLWSEYRHIFRTAETLGVTTADYARGAAQRVCEWPKASPRMAPGILGVQTCQSRPASSFLHIGHSDVGSSEPPTFVTVGDADGIDPPAAMERRVTETRYRRRVPELQRRRSRFRPRNTGDCRTMDRSRGAIKGARRRMGDCQRRLPKAIASSTPPSEIVTGCFERKRRRIRAQPPRSTLGRNDQ